MTVRLALGVVVFATLPVAAASDNTVTILRPTAQAGTGAVQFEPLEKLVGKSIPALFGPLSEVRVEREGPNLTGIEQDAEELEARIRLRIDRARCLGRDAEIDWHRAPWLRGYILLKSGRILPMQIMLSGVVVDGLLFDEPAVPPGAMVVAARPGVGQELTGAVG